MPQAELKGGEFAAFFHFRCIGLTDPFITGPMISG